MAVPAPIAGTSTSTSGAAGRELELGISSGRDDAAGETATKAVRAALRRLSAATRITLFSPMQVEGTCRVGEP